MIISPSREEDKEVAKNVLEILETTIRLYQKTGDERLVKTIENLNDWYDSLVEKIKHGDYTEEDARRMRSEKFWREVEQAAQKHYGDTN